MAPTTPTALTLVAAVALAAPPAAAQRTVEVGPEARVSAALGKLVQVEPVLAVDPQDPSRMVAAAIGLRRPFADDWQDHQTVVVYASRDGGRTWSRRPLAALPEAWTAGDPWLAWAPGGGVLLSAIAGPSITRPDEGPARVRVYRSPDGGWSWPGPGVAPFPAGSAQDHPVLAVGAGPDGGARVYLAGSHATSRDEGVDVVALDPETLAARSLPPFRPDVEQVNLGGLAVGPDGGPVLTFFSMRPPRGLRAARADREGRSWATNRIRGSIVPAGFPPLAAGPAPSGSSAGRLYAAWLESPDPAGTEVYLARSDDGGASWTEPLRVHRDTSRVSRTLPALAVAPGGAVAVAWQDGRHADGATCWDLYAAVSPDGGRSFLPEVRVSSETACPAYEHNGAAMGRFRLGGGDYQGLAATGPGAFQAVWSDSRTGRYQVWTARVRVR